jgi:hypothetical protein
MCVLCSTYEKSSPRRGQAHIVGGASCLGVPRTVLPPAGD